MPRKKTIDIIKLPPPPVKPFVPDAPITYNKKGFAVSTDKGLIHIDKKKNKIIIIDNKIRVYLAESGYTKSQKLFTINLPNKQLITERDYSMHRIVKFNAYAFDHTVISKAKQCTHVLLKEVRYNKVFRYLIPIKHILCYGKFQRNVKKNIMRVCMRLEVLEKNYLINE